MELDISYYKQVSVTYDHRLQKAGDPVRSPLHKLQIGRLVVEWVTISEYLLLYVFFGPFWVYPLLTVLPRSLVEYISAFTCLAHIWNDKRYTSIITTIHIPLDQVDAQIKSTPDQSSMVVEGIPLLLA
jgi:hypothetical protein